MFNSCSTRVEQNEDFFRLSSLCRSTAASLTLVIPNAFHVAPTGADYLKYDAVCGGDYGMPPLNASFDVLDWEQVVVSKMGVALNKTGRQIWCASLFFYYYYYFNQTIRLVRQRC
jgi:hypothetical protein